MSNLLITLALTIIPLIPHKIDEPTIRRVFAPIHVIENPLDTKVSITMDCGDDWEPPVIVMKPHTIGEYQFHNDYYDENMICSIDKWKTVK